MDEYHHSPLLHANITDLAIWLCIIGVILICACCAPRGTFLEDDSCDCPQCSEKDDHQ